MKKDLVLALQEKNLLQTVSPFADHPVMFVFSPPLKLETGINATEIQEVEEWFSTLEGNMGAKYQDFKMTIRENVAFTSSLEHLTGKRTDGTFTDVWYRETLGLIKTDGEWKISHQHQSVPFYMDGSKRAATDLKP